MVITNGRSYPTTGRRPDVASAIDAAQPGFVRLPWRACSGEGERILNAAAFRCAASAPEGTVPDTLDTHDLMAIAARAY